MKHIKLKINDAVSIVHRTAIEYLLKMQSVPRFIFILGHMRSGSTLLLHILASCPLIITGGERNKTYRNVDDLRSLVIDVCLQQCRIPLPGNIILDQINHDYMTPSNDVIDYPGLMRIFIVRRPYTTIQSIVRTFEPIYGNWPVERAARYYIDRILNLSVLAEAASDNHRSILIRYEDLTSNVQETLKGLQQFLSLPSALTSEYKLQKYTGTRGDPSSSIRAGKVLPERQESKLDIPGPLRKEALEAYERCIENISKFSVTG